MIETISVNELEKYIMNKNAIVIDVRSREEFSNKHIYGAINIEANNILSLKESQDKIIVLYCERGSSSLMAASKLSRAGYNVKSVVGGINAYNGRFLTKD